MMKFKKIALPAAGLLAGFLNGLFGSGGGVVAVMLIRPMISDDRIAHATSTLAMLIMSAVSFVLYLSGGQINLADGIRFLPGGVVGAVIGCTILKNIEPQMLRKVFGAAMVVSGTVAMLR